MKPHISDEQSLEADRPDDVAKRANSALKSGLWRSSWSQSADIEFCIQMKSGSSPPFEIHGRKTVASAFQYPLGCWIGGERRPSGLFGVGRAGGAGAGGSTAAPPPGFASGSPVKPQQRVAPSPQTISVSQAISVESHQGFDGGMWPTDQGWHGWQADPTAVPTVQSGMGIANAVRSKQLSAEAQEFVPGVAPMAGQPIWDGMVYQ